MTDQPRRCYFLMLYAAEPARDIYWPIFDVDDAALVGRMAGDLQPFGDAFPAGELWTDDGRLIWRKGKLDA